MLLTATLEEDIDEYVKIDEVDDDSIWDPYDIVYNCITIFVKTHMLKEVANMMMQRD